MVSKKKSQRQNNTNSTEQVASGTLRRRKRSDNKNTEEGTSKEPVKTLSKLGNLKEDAKKELDPVCLEAMKAAERDVATAKWYHGLMPREEIEALLVNEGDFLVRRTDLSGLNYYALSVRSNGKSHHVLMRVNPQGKWYVNKEFSRDRIGDLIEFCVQQKVNLIAGGGKLVTAVNRPEWYVLHDNIKLTKKLGEGNFGEVHMGELLLQNNATAKVAVKCLKGKMGKKERGTFVKEATLMRRFKHPNIVRILGVASQKEPIMILLELAAGGALKNHIRDTPDLPITHLQRYGLEAAQGMEYLADNNVIHRDIAARNCLLSAQDSVKISDFGLSVADKGQVTEVKLKNVPVKWLAPETLQQGVFNLKTDVWSFGVMLWEIFSRCKKDPYPGMTNADAKKAIVGEMRMSTPDGTPEDVGTVMQSCWKKAPEDRPSFKDIVKRLGGQPATNTQPAVADDKDNFIPEEYCYMNY